MSSGSTNNIPSSTPIERRTFFQRSFLAITVVVGLIAAAVFVIPFLLYLMGPMRQRKAPWVALGPLSKFPKGETRRATFSNPLGQSWDGMTANTGVFVRNLGEDANGKPQLLVFAENCAHLGCPVTWFPQSGLFMCPCHGGVYYENGERASGPPPRGLYHCEWQVVDGNLQVRAPHYPTLQNTLKT